MATHMHTCANTHALNERVRVYHPPALVKWYSENAFMQMKWQRVHDVCASCLLFFARLLLC